jgi:hypothetical protein
VRMTNRDNPSSETVSSGLHPMIYCVIVGFCVWLIFSIWGFLGAGYSGLVLSVASLFIGVVVALSLVLWHISRRRQGAAGRAEKSPLADWLSHDFAASSGNLPGSQAAIEVLLPIAAVAIGMSTFSVVLHLTIGS